jgi:hypothetical protein
VGCAARQRRVLNSICPTSGSVLVEDCDVREGADGVYVNTNFVHLLNYHIHGAQSRGIFGQNHFVIENSTVRGCGGYGMKTRGGWNSIQEGPWDMLIPPTPSWNEHDHCMIESYDDDWDSTTMTGIRSLCHRRMT